jgi:hypothetical protein
MAFFKKMKNFGEIIFENDYILISNSKDYPSIILLILRYFHSYFDIVYFISTFFFFFFLDFGFIRSVHLILPFRDVVCI